MKQQCFNPFLPNYEYIPDAEPRLFGDRVYIYGSHDKFNGTSFCVLDYVCWSAPANDLSDWRYEGVIFKKMQDSKTNIGFINSMYAPDVVQGVDGKYYMYYFIAYKGYIGVAVCDTPCGKFEPIGRVKYSDGVELGKRKEPLQFDPGVLVDDDGKVYMYTGFGPVNYPSILMGGKTATRKGPMVFELESDMVTIKATSTEPKYICRTKYNSQGTAFEGHEFFEAASMRKFDGKYYFIYSSFCGHELCYAVSDKPDEGFEFGGVLVSIGDLGIYDSLKNFTGNTHGSILKLEDKYYIFYHRQTNGNSFSRQACAEEIAFVDGKFMQAPLTSQSFNGKPLEGTGEYGAFIACHLYAKQGVHFYSAFKKPFTKYPYFTQTGGDRESNPTQYIKNMRDGSVATFKYFDLKTPSNIGIKVKGSAKGTVSVYTNDGETLLATIAVNSKSKRNIQLFQAELAPIEGTADLMFKFEGKGVMDFHSFVLA